MEIVKVISAALILVVGLFFTPMANAELALVSPGIGADGDPTAVEISPHVPVWPPTEENPLPEVDFRGAGFPLWYQDTLGLRLNLCLDGEEEEFPCAWEGAPVFTDAACTEPFYTYEEVVGFGDEAFYFKAQSYPFDVPLSIGGAAQLQLLLETTWGEDERFDPVTGRVGEQDIFIEEEDGTCVSAVGADLHRVEPGFEMLFARIRLRVLDGAPSGWYRMTYPYGVKTVFRPAADVGSRTEIRQVVGDLDAGLGPDNAPDYTIPLSDAGTLIVNNNFTIPGQYIGLRETGFVNDGDFTDVEEVLQLKSIGPFLVWRDYFADPDLRISEDGIVTQYIGVPADEDDPAAAPGSPVIGASFFDAQGRTNDGAGEYANYFKVQFLSGAAADQPAEDAWRNAPIVGFTDDFNLVGKVDANCAEGGNDPPMAFDLPEIIATAKNRAVTFDPFEGAIPGTQPIFKLITSFDDVEEGAQVIFNPNTIDVTYTPVADLGYTDVFTYTLRDACGTASEPALVTMVVEDLQIEGAHYRPRTGKWKISGTSTFTIEGEMRNEITLYAGSFDPENEEANRLIGTAIVDDEGSWTFSGKSTATPAAGSVTAVSRLGITTEEFDLTHR